MEAQNLDPGFNPALGRQRQTRLCLCEFEFSLVYIVSSGTGKATEDTLSHKIKNNQHFYIVKALYRP